MKMDRKQFSSGIVGAAIGVCSVIGINALSGHGDGSVSPLFGSSPHKATLYDDDGDVYITPKGKKFHRGHCFILRQSDEVKRTSRADVMGIGYEPCRKCRP